jgi:glycosyltransferase involved in cell wall biosynthesis
MQTSTDNGKVKVLVSAYACESGKGSEPGIGWNWVRQIARFGQVWVLTRANNREKIENALSVQPLANTRFIYYDLPRWLRPWKKGQRGIRTYYYLWQLGAYFAAKKLHRQVHFDLVHHVTFGKYWLPSFLAFLPTPFLWGPVGGGESAPRSFLHSLSPRGKVYELCRYVARSLGELDPFVRFTAKRAAVGIATTYQTERRLRALGCRNVPIFSHAALAPEEIQQLDKIAPRQSNLFRVFSVGGLLHLKAYDLGLRAFALFHRRFPESEYWLIGDGPERTRLQSLAAELEISECVTFCGVLPRAEVLTKLAQCDVLLHPALHESSGWASVEAMAAGRPVICLDLGGLALQVTKETGIKVPAHSPEQAVAELAEALAHLAQNPSLRAQLGRAARARVQDQFNWERKGEYLETLYRKVAMPH